MSDEPQYSSGGDSGSNKRKYEEQTTPPPSRRPTGFSAPISAASPDSASLSYNSVPPPADEIQLAKQRAQEIAARLFNNASAGAAAAAAAVAPPIDAKRPRVENGGGYGSSDNKGFSSAPSDLKPHNTMSAPSSIPVSYGYQGSSKKIDIPNGRVGVIIGKGGETIKYLQLQSGAKIQVTRDMDADLNSATRVVELMGTPEQVAKAEQLINDVLAGAESGGQGVTSRRGGGQVGSEQFVMKVPNNKVGLVIGKGGETIKNMQARTGARIQVIPLHLPPGDASIERTLQIDGTSDQIESAKQLVNEVISENRGRNPAMSGGYHQQGFQARPPASWGPPGAPPTQHPGYGYGQPGAYSGPQSHYNTQGSFSGYGQPTSGGYAPNWDQSAVPPTQQTSQGAASYDYYGQQQSAQQQQNPAATGADNSGYGYGQPPASTYQHGGQGYSQDSYGAYQAPQPAYGQPPSYDQQQQSYSASAYGNPSGATTDAHSSSYGSQGDSAAQPPSSVPPSSAGQQAYNTGQPSPNPNPNPASYQSQGANQPTYGVPPTSQGSYGQPAAPPSYGPAYGAPQAQKPPTNPPAYGQSAQSPSTPAGYGQQPSYSHSQTPPAAYAQPDSGSQRGPASSYGPAASQPSYGAPPYGAPAGYGQAPTYNAAPYGSGYSQPPAYSADGSSGGATRAAYDAAAAAAPASQSSQQSGAAKASPQS